MIIPLGSPSEATRIALFKRGRSRRVVAAKTDRHDADTAWINFRSRGKIVPGRRRVVLGVVAQVEVAKTDTLTIPWTIHDQAGNAAGDKVRNTFEVLNLFGDIEAVEENNRRHLARIIRWLGMNIDRGKARCPFIGNFDVLHARPFYVFCSVAKAIDASLIGVKPLFGFRL